MASDEETEKGLVSVNNIQWIRLNGRVECDLMLDNKNPRRESTHIRIDAKNGFEFFVPTQTATFLGPRSQKPTRENQIVVTRPLPTGQTDRLFLLSSRSS